MYCEKRNERMLMALDALIRLDKRPKNMRNLEMRHFWENKVMIYAQEQKNLNKI